MDQVKYIRETIERLNAERATVPDAFAKEVREIDANIEALTLASDKGPQIVALRMRKEEARTKHTARSAAIGGQIDALTRLFDRFHQNPVPPGTIVHGIDVSELDGETRAKVMAGDAHAVAVLGGSIQSKPTGQGG